MEEKLTGIVLRNLQTADNASLLTVLTAEKGRKLITCHGAKKLTGRNMPATQPFCFCEFVVSEKNGRLTLKESFLHESFFDLRCDLADCALGSYMLECADECAREDEIEEELLQLLLNSLYVLSRKKTPRSIVKAAFELRLLGIEGSGPSYDSCVFCGRGPEEGLRFSPADGGIVCKHCAAAEHFSSPLLPIDKGALEAIAYILCAPSKKLFSFRLSPASTRCLAEISEKCLLAFVDRPFESLQFYNTVKDDPSLETEE